MTTALLWLGLIVSLLALRNAWRRNNPLNNCNALQMVILWIYFLAK